MKEHLELRKAITLIFSSLDTVGFALLCMYIAWLITTPFDRIINGFATITGGIFGFAFGSVIFWLLSKRLSKRGSVS